MWHFCGLMCGPDLYSSSCHQLQTFPASHAGHSVHSSLQQPKPCPPLDVVILALKCVSKLLPSPCRHHQTFPASHAGHSVHSSLQQPTNCPPLDVVTWRWLCVSKLLPSWCHHQHALLGKSVVPFWLCCNHNINWPNMSWMNCLIDPVEQMFYHRMWRLTIGDLWSSCGMRLMTFTAWTRKMEAALSSSRSVQQHTCCWA